MDTSPTQLPHLRLRVLPQEGQKDCKSPRMREFAVRLCLLGTSEAPPVGGREGKGAAGKGELGASGVPGDTQGRVSGYQMRNIDPCVGNDAGNSGGPRAPRLPPLLAPQQSDLRDLSAPDLQLRVILHILVTLVEKLDHPFHIPAPQRRGCSAAGPG